MCIVLTVKYKRSLGELHLIGTTMWNLTIYVFLGELAECLESFGTHARLYISLFTSDRKSHYSLDAVYTE